MIRNFFKTLCIITIIALLVLPNFIFVGTSIAYVMYQELEDQTQETNNKNVSFDVYFKQGENIVHSNETKIRDNDNLYISINVNSEGLLDQGKIIIQNSNFKIDKDKIEDKRIKEVNEETGEIYLNQIANADTQEIKIPISFIKNQEFVEEDFNKETLIDFTGKYKTEQKEEEVKAQKTIRKLWTEDVTVNLTQNIEKYINLKDSNQTILQTELITQVEGGVLPRQEEILKIQVPVIQEQVPEEVIVLLNGNKLEDTNLTYNSAEGILEVQRPNTITESGKFKWENESEKYKIIYVYNNLTKIESNLIELKTELTTKLYTKESIKVEDAKQEELNQKGNIASLKTRNNS